MKNFRLIATIAASSLLASFAAQAYEKDMGYNYHEEPAEREQRFMLTGGATYLLQDVNGLDYATVDSGAAPVTANTYNLQPKYNWGYFLGFGYEISDRYDIQASWAQYNSNVSDNVSAAYPADTALQTSNGSELLLIAAGDTGAAHSSETLETNAAEITLGQYHKLTRLMTARPYVGVAYAKVDNVTENDYSGVLTAADRYDSKFNGVGPKVGLDAEYGIWDRLGLIGGIGAAFLIGEQESTSSVAFIDGGTGVVTQFDVKSGDNTRMIPALDAKLGLNWNSLYASNSWGLGVEGGYQVEYFFNVIDQVNAEGAAGAVDHTYSDIGIMGPYLNINVTF